MADHGAHVDLAPRTDLGALSEVGVGKYPRASTDADASLDDRVWTDLNVGCEFRGGINEGRRMNAHGPAHRLRGAPP